MAITLLYGLFVVGLFYVLGPVLIWFTFRRRVYSNYQYVAPEQLPPRVRDYFASVAPHLAKEGFAVAGYLHNAGAVDLVESYSACWFSRHRGQVAVAFAVNPAMGRAKFLLEFTTLASPSRQTVTTSDHGCDAGVFDLIPWRHTARFGQLRGQPGELYRVHLVRERRFIPPGSTRYLPAVDKDLREETADATACILREQVRTGLMVETSQVGVFRPTVRGAILLIVRLLPPARQIRMWRAKRETRRDAEEDPQLACRPAR
jgi:hypothetical protein